MPSPTCSRARPGPAQVAASLLSNFPFAGQVNLLTTGAFDSPQQLVSAGSLARGVAMVSLGASAGSRGDWAVQGAMTQGDVASWMVSGSYLTRAPARHVLDVGMSYSLQRYDGSNPSALAAVSDGNRYAGMVYAIDSWSVSDRVSLAYGARYAKYGYIEKSLLSPRARLTVAPVDTVRVSVGASRRALAPGAEEFVPSMVAGHVAAAGADVCAHQGHHLRAGADAASGRGGRTRPDGLDDGRCPRVHAADQGPDRHAVRHGRARTPDLRPGALLGRHGRRRRRARLHREHPPGHRPAGPGFGGLHRRDRRVAGNGRRPIRSRGGCRAWRGRAPSACTT